MDRATSARPALASDAGRAVERITDNIASVVHAPRETLRLCALCLVSEGHLIIEDLPGVGKTTLARAVARSFALSFRRIQCTPDLVPSDITGVSIFWVTPVTGTSRPL